MNLYKFNPNSAFFKPFEWLWYNNEEQVADNFKTMCPLFWAIIVSILLLPFILIIKAICSDTVDSWWSDRKAKKKSKLLKKFSVALNQFIVYPTRSHKNKLLKIVKCLSGSKDYSRYYVYENIELLYKDDEVKERARKNSYNDAVKKLENVEYDSSLKQTIKIEKVTKKVTQVATNKISTTIGFLLMVGLVLYCLYYLFNLASAYSIDWDIVKTVSIIIGSTAAGGLLLGLWIFPALSRCTFGGSALASICAGVMWIMDGISNIFLITVDMIYNLYKQNCPIITWEDDEEPTKMEAE